MTEKKSGDFIKRLMNGRFPRGMKSVWFFLRPVALTACAPEQAAAPAPAGEPGPGPAAEPDGENAVLAGLPDMDFGGEIFRVYFPNNPYSPKDKGFYTESVNGEKFNDAVFNRNAFIEEKYNVKIEARYGADWDSMYGDLKKDVGAGDASCDVYFSHIRAGVTGALADGLVRPWGT